MAEMNVRSDAVDVEQIMRQIRARIREKRGVDYTENELQQLASVKLEKFLDPRGVRSDLVEKFRRQRVVSPEPPKYEFEDTTLYDTHRGLLRTIRKLLHPILKLFINPNPLIHALHVQKQVNDEFHRRFRQREEADPLFYEVIHNLVVEVTRLGIEVHNLKMRVESLSSRMDFDERRGRSLESVVQYRPGALQRPATTGPAAPPAAAPNAPNQVRGPASRGPQDLPPTGGSTVGETGGSSGTGEAGGPGAGERRRRRRRRRRRPGQTMADGTQSTRPGDPNRGPESFGARDAGGADDGDGADGAETDDFPDVADDPDPSDSGGPAQ